VNLGFLQRRAFLILYVSYLILCDLFACHWDDEVVHTILERKITRENLEKGLFLIIFIPTVGTLVYFVVPIFSFVHDPFFINLNLVIILSFIWIYLCYWLFSRIAVLDWTRRTKNAAIAVLAILFVLGPVSSTYLYVLPSMAPFSPESTPSSEWIAIRPIAPEFDPAHSHEHGMRLQVARTFLNTSGLDQQYWTFHWTASYGSFVVIDPENHAVRQAGPDCYCPDSGCIVFWTWCPADQGKIKPPVSIYLSFENRLSKKIYAGTRLDLDWKAIDMVRVVER
jgi:hypothetical protein